MGVPFFVPDFTPKMREAAIDAMDNDRFILGEYVHKFEEAFARFVGVDHCVAVGSGTSALHLAVKGLGIEDTVVTTPSSFIASANAIQHAGAVPGFCEVDRTGNMDHTKFWKGMHYPTTVGAIMPVHLHGRPSDMDEINDIAADVGPYGIPVIEDACQAHGATYKGQMAGSLADVGCFSFYTTKNLPVGGDGGAMVTDDTDLADRVRSLANCGRQKHSSHLHNGVGVTSRLNSIQAAIGLAALDELPRWLERRRRVASMYREGLKDAGVTLPAEDTDRESAYHLFAINTPVRDELVRYLKGFGIGTGMHYPLPIHKQPAYSFHEIPDSFPMAESRARTTLSLPMHTKLTEADVKDVIWAIRSFHEVAL